MNFFPKTQNIYLHQPGQEMNIVSMWWDYDSDINYYHLIPNVEVDISIRPKEFQKLHDPEKCLPDLTSSEMYYDCYRIHVQESIHSEKIGEKFCSDYEFGNCTIPQVGQIEKQ